MPRARGSGSGWQPARGWLDGAQRAGADAGAGGGAAQERVGAQLASSRRGRAAAAATADQRLRSNISNPSSVYRVVEFDVTIPHTTLHTHIILHLFTRGPLHLFIITPTKYPGRLGQNVSNLNDLVEL